MWSEDDVPAPHEYIDATFGRGGYLAKRWGSGYQPRDGQITLARAVDASLQARTHLLSEAPTGTGKSLAYSVPATYHVATAGKVVVIVTANIALQEQLITKDLPLLGEVLPWAFSFGLMKGRGNYLCRMQYERIHLSERQQSMFEDGSDYGSSAADRDKRRLMQWATREIETRGYGDVSSLDWKPADKLWRELSVGPEDCRGSRCSFKDTCGALEAQRVARASQVVVTNYHVFFANLLIYMDRGIDVVLPPFDVAIFDEAHKAADVARDFFGWELVEGSVKRAVNYFRTNDPQAVEDVHRAAGWFFDQMLHLRRDRDRYKAHVVPERFHPTDIEAAQTLLGHLDPLRARLNEEIELFESLHDTERLGNAEVAKRKIDRAIGSIRSILDGGDTNEVVFIEEDEFRKARIGCRLIQPAQVLHDGLFGKTVRRAKEPEDGDLPDQGEPEPVSVVCTSATLATESGFAFAKGELGVTRCAEIVVDSPFDYERQALFIIPPVCDPNAPEFTSEVAALLLRTIELARGRTLGLFTSRKRMNDVYDLISTKTPFRIMRQSDGQRTQLVEEFKRDVHSVLLGVASFWAGVDVPGESLSVVFIDKIPFPTPDDPVLERLAETDRRAWNNYAVPRAIIEFKQGFGRLIRTSTDRGVVVCCDARILTKGYGKQFLRAMPKQMQKIRNLEAIREWLDGPAAQATEEVDPLS